jgi:nicotinamidase-related amidase
MSETDQQRSEPLPFNPEDYTLEEILRPEHSALLVIDMQNDFLSPGGFFDKKPEVVEGEGIEPMRAIIPNIQALIERARQARVPIIFTRGYEDVKFRTRSGFRRAIKWDEHDGDGSVNSQSGTWGSELIDALQPQEGDTVLEKHKWSAFDGTDSDGLSLDDILKKMGIQTLVLTGVVTETCVHSTAQEAYHKDYLVVVPKNSVGSNKPDQHKTVLDRFDFLGDAVEDSVVHDAWQRSVSSQAPIT